MTTTFELKSNGTRGEVTPLAYARSDAEFYKAAYKTLSNWMVLHFGVVTRRPGTRFGGAVKVPTSYTELIPFVYDAEQAYWLEFGHEYIRFWKPDGQVMDGGDPYEIVSPYTAAQVSRIQWAQSNDVLFLAHPDVFPQKLSRLADDDWTIGNVDFRDGPYLPINDTTTAISISPAIALNATTTLTASSTTGINGGLGFLSTDVGRMFRQQRDGKWDWGVIESVTDSTHCVVRCKSANYTVVQSGSGFSSTFTNGTSATTTWRLGVISDTTGYFGSVQWTDMRLAWARTQANKSIVCLSQPQLPEDYEPSARDGTVADDAGVVFDINAAGEILWLQEGPKLQIGTPLTIRTLGAQGSDDVVTPRNVGQKIEVNNGTVPVPPIRVGPSTLHFGRFGTSLNDLVYDYNTNALADPELSTLSNHLFKHGGTRLAYAQHPNKVVWSTTEAGVLIGMTFNRDEKVLGFHPHPMTNGSVETVCVIPDSAGKRDALGMIIKRTIDGEETRYFEVLDPLFDSDLMDQDEAFFVDCGKTYTGTATGTMTGLDHLEGETVDIYADGAQFSQQTVTGGEITLPGSATAETITVGLPIDNEGATLAPMPVVRDGATLGRKKRAATVIVDQVDTIGLNVGPSDTDDLLEVAVYRSSSVPMGQAPPLYTGTTRLSIESAWSTDASIKFKVVGPFPGTIRALNLGVDTE